ncbi:MAG: glycosyltransferase [Gemmataceae bacterium]
MRTGRHLRRRGEGVAPVGDASLEAEAVLNSPAITVAICTWNRAKLLEQTLARLAETTAAGDVPWELIVVNNNCTDETDAVIAKHAGTLPLVRLFEPKPGLSNARNCATAAARGEVIVWTDDDVLVEPGWLAAYAAAAARWPEAVFFGGRITPWYEREPPDWIARHLKRFEGMLVVRDLGTDERRLQPGEYPYGANMAFRTAALRGLQFNPALGKTKDVCLLAEETELFRRFDAEGRYGVWVPSASVRHYVTAARLTRAYAWSYFHGLGRTSVRTGEMRSGAGRRLWGAPRWLYRRYWRDRATAVVRRITGRDWVEPYLSAATWAGVIHETRLSGV